MGVGPTGGQGAGSKVHVSTESVAWRTVSCWGGGEVLEIAKGRIMSYLSFRVKGPTTTTTTTADATLTATTHYSLCFGSGFGGCCV